MYRALVGPALRLVDAERAHHLALLALEASQRSERLQWLLRRLLTVSDTRLQVHALGLTFANPIGLAAGFDKDVRVPAAIAALGFGHVEVGTITPRPQPGKPRPRIFRLPADRALINRLGFPNAGMAAAAARLGRLRKPHFVLGVNIGANAESVAAGSSLGDYAAALQRLEPYADYVVANVSSPNTDGLRRLQLGRQLENLLHRLRAMAAEVRSPIPILVKVAPDLSPGELAEVVAAALAGGAAGLVATNTTLARPSSLRSARAQEPGGLSGRPLRARSTELIRQIRQLTAGRLPIIGAGGVFTVADALEKLRAGASLVQLYTGFIYQGPTVARDINRGLLRYLEEHACSSIGDIIGQDAD
ncbi:MAG: quinone-dependent dihydroorotate dehydrogenase [Chloroflexota bacterium]